MSRNLNVNVKFFIGQKIFILKYNSYIWIKQRVFIFQKVVLIIFKKKRFQNIWR